jgi:dTDP-4-dehydrorhamnose reductase
MKTDFSSKEGILNSPSGDGGIMVTGANGQLGMELRELSVSYSQYNFIFLSHNELAIENADEIKLYFEKNHPQFCINCAAYTAVDKAELEKEQAFLINGEAVGNLAVACKEHNTKFIHISTDYVFDGTASVPYKEDAPVNPQSVYGASKLEGEKLALQYNPETSIIRTSWVYSSYGKNFVKTMLKLMKEKEEINIVNDQRGSPTYAGDLAEAIMQIIGKLTSHPERQPKDSRLPTDRGIYHYSNDGIITWYDFAIAVKELTGSSCRINPITTDKYPTPAKRPLYSVLDKIKIHETFGIKLKDWKASLFVCLKKIKNTL